MNDSDIVEEGVDSNTIVLALEKAFQKEIDELEKWASKESQSPYARMSYKIIRGSLRQILQNFKSNLKG